MQKDVFVASENHDLSHGILTFRKASAYHTMCLYQISTPWFLSQIGCISNVSTQFVIISHDLFSQNCNNSFSASFTLIMNFKNLNEQEFVFLRNVLSVALI